MCCIYNLVFDLQQEAPSFFAARLKADFDSEMTQTEKSYLGGALAKFWLLASVGENDSDSEVTWTGENKLRGGTPCNILVHRFSC